MEEPENLLIVCNTCNSIKRDKFPVDDEGTPLLINPMIESYAKHIKQLDNGYLEGISEKGNATIETLQLNRPGLPILECTVYVQARLDGMKPHCGRHTPC
jgi:hypothetical protein